MKKQFLDEPSEQNANKKQNRFLLGIISLAVITLASCSNWGFPDPEDLSIPNWGKSTTAASNNSQFHGTAMDADGNIIAVGWQGQSVYSYGDGVTVSGGHATGSNAVLVKYNALTGKTLWAKSTTTASDGSMFNAVATEKDGNIYAVGYQKNGSFGYGNGVTAIGAYTGYNAVLVKYNSDGQAIWARSTTTASDDSMFNAVATDKDGNIYVTGYQNENGSFGYGNGVTMSGAYTGGGGGGSNNAVVVKYNSDGQAQWARSVNPAPSKSGFNGVAVDDSGVYAVGYRGSGKYGYGNGIYVEGNVTSGYLNIKGVIVKYSFEGTTLWATTEVSQDGSRFSAVAIDKYGAIYTVGRQEGSVADYGNGVTAAKSGCTTAPVVVKYSSAGMAQWAKSTATSGGCATPSFKGVATTFAGDVYAVGVQGQNEFDWGNGIKTTGTNTNYNPSIVAYNTDGKTMWAKTTTKGTEFSTFNGITAGNYKLFVVGYQNRNGEFNYGNGAGDIKGAYAGGSNVVITTFGH